MPDPILETDGFKQKFGQIKRSSKNGWGKFLLEKLKFSSKFHLFRALEKETKILRICEPQTEKNCFLVK